MPASLHSQSSSDFTFRLVQLVTAGTYIYVPGNRVMMKGDDKFSLWDFKNLEISWSVMISSFHENIEAAKRAESRAPFLLKNAFCKLCKNLISDLCPCVFSYWIVRLILWAITPLYWVFTVSVNVLKFSVMYSMYARYRGCALNLTERFLYICDLSGSALWLMDTSLWENLRKAA